MQGIGILVLKRVRGASNMTDIKIPVETLKNGFKLPVFGFGAYRIGGRRTRDPLNDDKENIKSLRKALDLGITHIDTAEMYAGGYNEVLVGKAIKGYDRSKLLISTKVSPMNLEYQKVISSAKNSLKKMNIDYLDLYNIHYPSFEVPVSETMRAMDHLVDEGLVRYIGVSNFDLGQFQEAQKYSGNKIVANQIPYSLINRKFQADGFIDFAGKNDVMTVAWMPIEGGKLGKRGIELLDLMCDRYNKTPAQVAINWLISQKNVVTMPGSRNTAHLEENLGALGWSLSPEDQKKLDDDFPGKDYISLADNGWKEIWAQYRKS